MDINKLKTFYYVALEGSYQKASVFLGIKSSYISKHITFLENHFKFKLFTRSHRSLILTDNGQELLKSVQSLMHQLEKIEEFSNAENKEDHIIRIVTTTGVTNLWLVRKLKEFTRLYPNYKLRIIAVDEKVDMATHYADVGILPKASHNPNIIQSKLFTFHTKLFASKKYLEEFGIPKTLSDLDNHRLIGYYHNEAGHRGNLDWHLSKGTKNDQIRIPYLIVNSAIGLYEALVQGLGIVVATEEFTEMKSDHGLIIGSQSLVKILPNEGVDVSIYFSMHHLKLKLNKVKILSDFLNK